MSESEVANEFAEYFSSVAQSCADKIKTLPGDSPNKLNTLEYSTESLFLTPVTPTKILLKINELNVRKAAGLGTITARVVKCCGETIAPVLATIVNNCFREGIYPDGLKIARVVPIHKAGNAQRLENYRPISVLPILNNIVERVIIMDRLLNFLENEKFFNCRQYGFRRKVAHA